MTPALRRLLLVASLIVFVDMTLFAAIAPILPKLRDDLHLSKSVAGIVFACYPAGVFLGALPSAALGTRLGVKVTALAGLVAMTVAGLTFGVANSAPLLMFARFLQGFGGAATWAGTFAWLGTVAPPDRRGELIGSALGAGLGGALGGPMLGALAGLVGRAPVFCGFALFGVVLYVLAARIEGPAAEATQLDLRGLPRKARDRRIVAGAWLVGVAGIAFGAIGVLVPLRLDALGASSGAIALIFLAAAGLEAGVAPLAGRLSDRRGRFAPVRIGLPLGAIAVVCLGLPSSALLIGVILVIAGPLVGVTWAPSFALLTDGAEARGIPLVLGMAIMNVGWSIGETAGGAGGGALAALASDQLVYILLAVALVATVFLRESPAQLPERKRTAASGI